MRSASFVGLLLLGACNLPATLTKEEALTCEAETFRLTGTIDGALVETMQSSETGGFTQGGGGDFASVNKTRQIDASMLADVRLLWADDIATGDSAPATGTFVLPGTRVAGQTFCADKGTAVRIVPSSEGGGLQFRLSGLSTGMKCDKPHQGSLLGCWRPAMLR